MTRSMIGSPSPSLRFFRMNTVSRRSRYPRAGTGEYKMLHGNLRRPPEAATGTSIEENNRANTLTR